MGCHTWFNRRIKNQPKSKEQKAQIAVKFIENQIKILKDKDDVILFKEEIERIKNNELYEEALNDYYRFSIYSEYLITYCNNVFYEDVAHEGYHDLFRIHNYDEPPIFNLEETYTRLKERNINLNNEEDKKLKDFWSRYPEGMIEFG